MMFESYQSVPVSLWPMSGCVTGWAGQPMQRFLLLISRQWTQNMTSPLASGRSEARPWQCQVCFAVAIQPESWSFTVQFACGEIWMALSSRGISVFVLGPKIGCFYGVELSVFVEHCILPKEQSCTPWSSVLVSVVYTKSGHGDEPQPSLEIKCLLWNAMGI